jgi:hypothetical protein
MRIAHHQRRSIGSQCHNLRLLVGGECAVLCLHNQVGALNGCSAGRNRLQSRV